MTIAIATCSALPDGDEDGKMLRAALTTARIDSVWHTWNDPGVDWTVFDLVVLRTTWDYTQDLPAFLRWVGGLERVLNPADVVAWNTDKTYLRELTAAGVPTVPTTWAAPGESIVLPDTPEFVIKPSVGAGSKGAGRFASGDPAASAHAAELHEAGRTVMTQPYLLDVDAAGETALIYLDGRYSHAIRKGAMLPENSVNGLDVQYSRSLYVDEKITPRVPEAVELELGHQALDFVRAKFGADLLYTRVDLLPTGSGPVVIELELVEPSLFLEFDPAAADLFATAIRRRLRP